MIHSVANNSVLVEVAILTVLVFSTLILQCLQTAVTHIFRDP